VREEYEVTLEPLLEVPLERELPVVQRLWQQGWLRKSLILLALLWFGLGQNSLIFVLVHSVLWALALNSYAGFLGGVGDLAHGGAQLWFEGVALCAVHPDSGGTAVDSCGAEDRLGVRLAHLDRGGVGVWRATSGKGGLGWYIFQNRNELYTDKVFAGLAVVILIGLLVENLVFDTLERVTVKRWGMQR